MQIRKVRKMAKTLKNKPNLKPREIPLEKFSRRKKKPSNSLKMNMMSRKMPQGPMTIKTLAAPPAMKTIPLIKMKEVAMLRIKAVTNKHNKIKINKIRIKKDETSKEKRKMTTTINSQVLKKNLSTRQKHKKRRRQSPIRIRNGSRIQAPISRCSIRSKRSQQKVLNNQKMKTRRITIRKIMATSRDISKRRTTKVARNSSNSKFSREERIILLQI